MYREIEVPDEEVVIVNFVLKIFDKNKGKINLQRYFKNKEEAINDFHNKVNMYHNLNGRYVITLFDLDKQTNIEHYDSDDEI